MCCNLQQGGVFQRVGVSAPDPNIHANGISDRRRAGGMNIPVGIRRSRPAEGATAQPSLRHPRESGDPAHVSTKIISRRPAAVPPQRVRVSDPDPNIHADGISDRRRAGDMNIPVGIRRSRPAAIATAQPSLRHPHESGDPSHVSTKIISRRPAAAPAMPPTRARAVAAVLHPAPALPLGRSACKFVPMSAPVAHAPPAEPAQMAL